MDQYTLAPANFNDYRDFLKNRFQFLQAQNKRFSLQACATKAKLSKSLLQFLFQKKRHVSLDKIPDLSRGLKLTADEEYFVYLMLCKATSRNPVVQEHFEKILDRVRHQYIAVTIKEPTVSKDSEKAFYLDFLLMVCLALIRLPNFREDHDWILKNLKIPGLDARQIQNALTKLENLGRVVRDDLGRLIAKPESLWRPDPYDPSGQNVFTAAADTIAKLMKVPSLYKPSVYMAMALSFDEERLLTAERLMVEVHHKLSALSVESKHPTAIAYIGNFFLTVARLP